MDDQQLRQTLYPEPRPLADSTRTALREELFGRSRTSVDGGGRSTSPTVAHTRIVGARPSRRGVAAAAAAVGLVGLGGLWVASGRDTVSEVPAQQPTTRPVLATTVPADDVPGALGIGPTAFPVVDGLPTELSASASVHRIASGSTSPRSEALVARRVDNALVDAVRITAWPEPFEVSPMQNRTPADTVVLSQAARVHDRSVAGRPPFFIVTWGSGPYFMASGEAPLVMLDRADSDAITAAFGGDATPPQLSLGSLPDGFDAIVEPQSIPGDASITAVLSIGADNFDISVHSVDPLLDMAASGFPLTSVEIDGRPGWTFLSSAPTQDITWQIDDFTYAYLKVNDGSSADEALALADQITFVDFETWSNRYGPEVVDVPTSTPATSG